MTTPGARAGRADQIQFVASGFSRKDLLPIAKHQHAGEHEQDVSHPGAGASQCAFTKRLVDARHERPVEHDGRDADGNGGAEAADDSGEPQRKEGQWSGREAEGPEQSRVLDGTRVGALRESRQSQLVQARIEIDETTIAETRGENLAKRLVRRRHSPFEHRPHRERCNGGDGQDRRNMAGARCRGRAWRTRHQRRCPWECSAGAPEARAEGSVAASPAGRRPI